MTQDCCHSYSRSCSFVCACICNVAKGEDVRVLRIIGLQSLQRSDETAVIDTLRSQVLQEA